MDKINLNHLALGSAILGSGGGGDPAYDLLMAQHAFEKYGVPRLIALSDLKDDDLIVPFDYMGAPLVATEKLPSGREFILLAEQIEKTMGQKISALVAGEIGGGNAFTALTAASQLGLPVVDADLIGRAFPQLQMCTPVLNKISSSPAFLADSKGNLVILKTIDPFELEDLARAITVAMGSQSALASFLMQGSEAKLTVIPGSISRASGMGKTLREEGILGLTHKWQGTLLAQGTITDIQQTIQEGFLEGSVNIATQKEPIRLIYQNEYLFAKEGVKTLCSTPDILALIESGSGTPITSESLKYGLRVDLIAFEAPSIWKTEAGLNLVGPEVFRRFL